MLGAVAVQCGLCTHFCKDQSAEIFNFAMIDQNTNKGGTKQLACVKLLS